MTEFIPWITVETKGNSYFPKIDMRKLAMAIFHLVTRKEAGIAIASDEAIGAFGLKPDPAHLAGHLIQRAITSAFRQIIDENRYRFNDNLPDEPTTIAFFSREYSKRTVTTIDNNFFRRPHELPLIQEVAKPFCEWLIGLTVPPEEANRIAKYLFPLLFLNALNAEWRSRAEFYKSIITGTDSPFQPAAEREYEWVRYRFQLQSEFNATPLFDEDFSLESVYVPLRAFIEHYDDTRRGQYVYNEHVVRQVVDAESHILSWLGINSDRANMARGEELVAISPSKRQERPQANQFLCVLSGGPGSGKSSLCKKLAARLAREGRRVLLIPMHFFVIKADIPTSIGSFLERTKTMTHNPLQWLSSEHPLVLIFDGLDEGGTSEKVTQTFLNILKDYLRDENVLELRVQAIISGREIVIQTHGSEFRDKTTLQLLPYLINDKPYINSLYKYSYNDKNNLCSVDQREIWWRLYTKAKDGQSKDMPLSLKQNLDLAAITEQPLLNYLLALSHRRGEIDFVAETNRSAIYADLLKSVYAKRYGGENPVVADLSFRDFTKVLGEIGLAVYHGNRRTAKLKDIQDQCKRLSPDLLTKFKDGAETNVTRVLTAFYFHMTEAHDPTFEFTHRSFGEYVTAQRFVSCLYDLQNIFSPHWPRLSESREEQALIEWTLVFGPTPLDPALLRFLREELALIFRDPKGQADIAAFQKLLCRLIETALRDGIPVHRMKSEMQSFAEMDRWARNSEEALLAAVNACALVTKLPINILWSDKDEAGQWKEPQRAGTWLHRLCGQRRGWEAHNPLAWNCLSWLDLSFCDLRLLDLQSADLHRSVLHGACLNGANLHRATLIETDLSAATLCNADLTMAYMRKAILDEADLHHTNLYGTDLHEVDLSRINNIEFSMNLDKATLHRTGRLTNLHTSLLQRWADAQQKPIANSD